MQRTLAFLSLLVMLSTTTFARADAGSSAAAEALFSEGKALVAAKNFAAACPKFEASQKLDPGAGTLLHLGSCYESLGKIASAWATYIEAGAAARARNRRDWADNAAQRALRLEPRLPRLTVLIKTQVPGLEVVRDGVRVETGALGSALPVDPGSHKLEALAKGYKPWSKSFDATEKAALTIEIPALEAEPVVAVPTPAVAVQNPVPQAPIAKQEKSAGGGLRTVGFVSLGLGAAGLAVGGVTGLMAMQANNKGKDLCPEIRCSNQEGVDAAARSRSFGTVSTIGFIAGGALAATGLVLVLAGGGSSSRETATRTRTQTFAAPSLALGLGPAQDGSGIGTWLSGVIQ
jgi:hypothetical protein